MGKKTQNQFNFSVVVESDKDRFFVLCPELQGCYSQGNTYEEAIENIKDAIKLHLEDRLAKLALSTVN